MRFSQKLVLQLVRTKFTVWSTFSKKKAARKAFELFCTPQHRNKKELPRIFGEAEVLRFNFHQYKIQGYRWQKGGTRKVLILHGFESSVVNFDRYVRPLMRKGYEVLAFDAPGHGRSTGRQINVQVYKEFIMYLFQQYGPIQSFMAHSLGGLSLSLALEELPHNEDTRVALIAPATETTTAIDTYFRFLKLETDVRTEFDKLIQQISGHEPQWFSVARVLPQLKAQILWAHDRDDHMTPISDVEPVMKMAYPNVQFKITEGLGHRRIYRDNNVTKAVVAFL
jgi:esterase/lipase